MLMRDWIVFYASGISTPFLLGAIGETQKEDVAELSKKYFKDGVSIIVYGLAINLPFPIYVLYEDNNTENTKFLYAQDYTALIDCFQDGE